MVDIARLEIQADSTQVRTGTERLDDLSRAAGGAERSAGSFRSGFASMGSMIRRWLPVLTAAGAALQFRSAVNEQEQLQRNMLRTSQIIRTTGADAWASAEQMRLQAVEMARGTLQSTEAVMQAQQTMLTFRNVTGETFQRALELSTDLASAMRTDLNSAVLQVSKALEDPERGLTALSRSGTVFTQTQRDMISEMVRVGDLAGAQKLILDELAGQYGGTARAEAMGFAGAQDTLKQSFQEAKIALMDWLGTGDMLAGWFRRAAGWLDNFTSFLSSGQIDYYLAALSHSFAELGRDIEHVFRWATTIIDTETRSWRDSFTGWSDFLRDAFFDMPGNLRDLFNIMALEIQVFARRVRAYGENIAGYLDPRSWFSSERRELLRAQLDADLAIIEQDWFMRMDEIATERDNRKAVINDAISDAARVRVEWERTRESFRGFQGDFSRAVADMSGGDDAGIEQIQRRLDMVRQANMTEIELQQERYAREIEALNLAFANELLTREEWHAQIELSYARHTEALTGIEEKAARQRDLIVQREAENKKRILGGALSSLTTLMNSESRKMFEIGKIAAISQSLIATYQGMSEALKLGWPMGPIAASAIGVAGFANVQAIRSQSFGAGGGASGSVTNAVSAASAPAQPQRQQERVLFLENVSPSRIFQGGELYGLIDAINEAADDGYPLRVVTR